MKCFTITKHVAVAVAVVAVSLFIMSTSYNFGDNTTYAVLEFDGPISSEFRLRRNNQDEDLVSSKCIQTLDVM